MNHIAVSILLVVCTFVVAAAGQQPVDDARVFSWLPEGLPVEPATGIQIDKTFKPTDSQWGQGLDEHEVFHARLSPKGGNWEIGIGQGGQIYSIRGPFGQAIPPQVHQGSQWNDEVWQLVAVSQKWQRYAGQSGWPYYIHGSGIYLKDPKHSKNFYCPIVAESFDPDRRSYTLMTWGQQAHVPTPFRSGVFYTTRLRVIDEITLEVVYGVHNWGEDVLDFFNVPWGGVRATTFPVREIAQANGQLIPQSGSFPTPKQGKPLTESQGWLLFSISDKPDSPSLGLVVGREVDATWPEAEQLWRGGYAGNPEQPNKRDYFVTALIVRGPLQPGESFWASRFYVIGPRADVIQRCVSLAGEAKVRRIQWNKQTAPRLGEQHWAVPVPGTQPQFLITDLAGNKSVITTDPYTFADKQPVANPMKKNDPRYEDYENLKLLRPYATRGACAWRFLGFIQPDVIQPETASLDSK
ncbi:MAG: hypothetical protein GC164_07180 [Phycisphaera sp.]|nr:hypothetical protein [Phycisphaera sp.]